MMKCPICNIEIKNLELEHMELHICEKCDGIWFDKDEFVSALKFLESDNIVPYDRYNPFSKKIHIFDPQLYTKRNCPKCNATMAPPWTLQQLQFSF